MNKTVYTNLNILDFIEEDEMIETAPNYTEYVRYILHRKRYGKSHK